MSLSEAVQIKGAYQSKVSGDFK